MKAIKMEGIVPKIVDMDYAYLCEQKKKYEGKGKLRQAQYLGRLIEKINAATPTGVTPTMELIEDVVNDMIDSNRAKRKQLKEQVKALDAETDFLRGYSKRETDEDVSDIILFI